MAKLTSAQVATIAGYAHQHMLEYMRAQGYIPHDAHPDIIEQMASAIREAVADLEITVVDSSEIVPELCPNCNAVLTASPIPEKDRHHYTRGATHFTRKIWTQSPTHDLEWGCPDCGHRWRQVVAAN